MNIPEALRRLPSIEPVTITLADNTQLPGCRPDLVNVGDLMARGWSLIPVRYKSKLPAVRWESYQKRFATLDEIEEWFSRPPYNLGIVTGKLSRIFVVDCDSPEALEWAREKLPPTELRVRTRKGLHLYYPYSGERPMRNRVRVKFDGRQLRHRFSGRGRIRRRPGLDA